MVAAGEIHRLDIEKPAAGGAMIARADGQVVLVRGAIPGERARVRIDRVAKGVAHGTVAQVELPSPDRQPPFVDPLCGGCLYSHIAYARQLALKAEIVADGFARIGRMPLQAAVHVVASPQDGYRMRARLHLRDGRLGFFREGSHDVCEARATRQLLPESADAVDRALAPLLSRGVTEAEVDLSENVDTSERAVHVALGSRLPDVGVREPPPGLTGLIVMSAGHGVLLECGSADVTDRLVIANQAVRLRRHVLAFFQGNRFLLTPFVEHVTMQCAGARTAIDLYAGVGLFSVALAAQGVHVVAVEGDRVAAEGLRANARDAAGLEAVHQAVERFTDRSHRSPDVLLVDPPRTGLSREALQGVIKIGAPRLVYVSCDVATLARDARGLADAGFRLEAIEAFDLFPNTPHIETVAVFVR